MAADTQHDWIARVCATDPGRVCLVSDGESLTYGEVHRLVEARAREISASIREHEIVVVEVEINLRTIIELLAIQRAGGVPFPYVGEMPELPVATVQRVAVCVSTSGTSGRRRIVPLTYSNIAASVRASRRRLGNDADDRWLLSLPLNHVGGLSVLWRSLEAGGAVVVAPFDASGEPIEQHRPTFASMVPTMVHRLFERNPGALASIGAVLVGGASLTSRLWRDASNAGAHLVTTYGMTEAGSQIATLAPGDERRESGLVGAPLEGFSVTIVDADGVEVPTGVLGRVSVEGPAVFLGYLGEEPRPQPFITSDLGRMSETGDLFIEGRGDDVIITGGENVSLRAVEAAIAGLFGVKEVCVVALDDSEWGMVTAAIIVAEAPDKAIRWEIAGVLKPHERPKHILFRRSIPLLPNGKHDIKAVRAVFCGFS